MHSKISDFGLSSGFGGFNLELSSLKPNLHTGVDADK